MVIGYPQGQSYDRPVERPTDLTKEIREAHIGLERMNMDLTSLDRVIAQFDSTHKVPRRRTRGQGPRGSVTKAILNMIRIARLRRR